jgi:pimeloyl-ACP methyl ester carboxylesterase
MGSSLGGLTSWYAAFVHPEGVRAHRRVLAFVLDRAAGLRTGAHADLPRGTRMYQSIGDREGGDAKDQSRPSPRPRAWKRCCARHSRG